MVTFSLFNPNGSLQADLTKRLPKYLGTYSITGSQQTGTITHPEFSPGRPFLLSLQWPSGVDNTPRVAIFADRIEWRYDQPVGQYPGVPVSFDFGVY